MMKLLILAPLYLILFLIDIRFRKCVVKCDKPVDVFLSKLNFFLDWFVTNKRLEKLDEVAFSNDNIDLSTI